MRIPWTEYNTKLPTLIAGGTAPDVMLMLYMMGHKYGELNAVMDLNEFIEKDPEFNAADYIESSLQTYDIDGKQVALPNISSAWLLYYNKDMFDSAGLSYPSSEWLWEGEFLDAAQKLTKDTNSDGKPDVFGYTQNLWFNRCHNILIEYGGNYFNEDASKCTMDKPESVKAIQFLYDLLHKHKVMPTPDQLMGQSFQAFFSGERAAMFMSGYFFFERVLNDTKANWGMSIIPSGPKGNFQIDASNGIAIVNGTKHPDEAWEVVKAFMSKEAVRASMDFQYHIGYHKEVLQDGSELSDYFYQATVLKDRKNASAIIDALRSALPIVPIPNGAEVMRVQADKLWQPMWNPGQNIPQLCRETTAALNDVISE
jgi:multiple sugar transport system substrate-binding protein